MFLPAEYLMNMSSSSSLALPQQTKKVNFLGGSATSWGSLHPRVTLWSRVLSHVAHITGAKYEAEPKKKKKKKKP